MSTDAGETTALERTAVLALRLASRCTAEYSSPYSRRDFTQRQLVACLVIRGSRGLTYRATAELLKDSPGLRAALGLCRAPHYTTLESLANSPGMRGLIDAMLRELMLTMGRGRPLEAPEVALDSTGLHATGASAYFAQRSQKAAGFVKVSALVVCGLMLPCAMVLSWGSSNDLAQGPAVVLKASMAVRARTLYADAGYDGERLHRLCREQLGITSWIPPVPKTADGSIRTKYRSMMSPLPRGYGRRWQVESFFSALKRTTGPGLRARGRNAPLVEAAFKILGYAVNR